MHDKQVVRRRRAVLVSLIVLSIVLLTGYFGEGNGGFFHGIQHTAQVVLSPIETGASRAFKPVRDAANWFGDVFDAKSQNTKLKSELASARALLAEDQTARNDDAQLRAMVGLPRTAGYPQDTRPVTAQVIVKDPTVWYSAVVISKGSGDGLKVDQPVIAQGGLAGKITAVTSSTATVTLITDATSAVSGEVEPGAAAGIVTPAVGNPDDMLLRYIPQGSTIKKGDTVITSGFRSGNLQSLFPRGIPIGRVTRVSPDELQTYQLVHVEPYVNLRQIDYVQVLTGGANVSQAQAGSTPTGG